MLNRVNFFLQQLLLPSTYLLGLLLCCFLWRQKRYDHATLHLPDWKKCKPYIHSKISHKVQAKTPLKGKFGWTNCKLFNMFKQTDDYTFWSLLWRLGFRNRVSSHTVLLTAPLKYGQSALIMILGGKDRRLHSTTWMVPQMHRRIKYHLSTKTIDLFVVQSASKGIQNINQPLNDLLPFTVYEQRSLEMSKVLNLDVTINIY